MAYSEEKREDRGREEEKHSGGPPGSVTRRLGRNERELPTGPQGSECPLPRARASSGPPALRCQPFSGWGV